MKTYEKNIIYLLSKSPMILVYIQQQNTKFHIGDHSRYLILSLDK